MRTILLVAALLAGSATAASAQATLVKVNLLSPLVLTGSASVERQLAPHRSVQLEALYTRWNGVNLVYGNATHISGFALVPEYREYLSPGQGPLQGVYLSTFFRFRHLNLLTDYTEQTGPNQPVAARYPGTLTTYGGGVAVGYQWRRRRFSLDTYLGPSFDVGTVQEEGGLPPRGQADASMYQGFKVRTGLTFGYAF